MNLLLNKIIIYVLNLFNVNRDYKLNRVEGISFISRHCSCDEARLKNIIIAAVEIYSVFGINIPILLFTDDFVLFSDETKRFIVYHEIGHSVLHHNKDTSKLSIQESFILEHDADIYVANTFGKALVIKSLDEIYRFLINEGYLCDDLKERMFLMELIS